MNRKTKKISLAPSLSDLSGRRQTSVQIPLGRDITSMEKFKELANRCHTPAQFKTLLDQLEKHIPYEGFACGWGNPALYAVSFFYTRSYPKEFLNWYLTTGMLGRDPAFNRWLSTQQPQIFSEVVEDLGDQFPRDFIQKINEFKLWHMITGGRVEIPDELVSYFSVVMRSREECELNKDIFKEILPLLHKALFKTYPSRVLTPQQTEILCEKCKGKLNDKGIAEKMNISVSTVKKQLTEVRKRLCAKSSCNAVAIAMQNRFITIVYD